MTETKTLAQVVQTCDFIRNSRCKDCLGQCEFEGTEHFKGKWVLEADVLREHEELKALGKSRPVLPKFYEGNDKDIRDAQWKDLIRCYNWFEKFDKVLAVLGKETKQ